MAAEPVARDGVALRCLIVDDNAAFRAVAREFLESEGMDVVGVASSSAEGISRVAELRPDVALVDIDLGQESGFDLVRRIVGAQGRTPPSVILISAYDEREYADMIDSSPALGFIPKLKLSAEAIYALLARGGRR